MSQAKRMSASEVWKEVLAPKFIRFREILVTGAKPHGRKAMDSFGPRPGDLAIDVGCGFGDATLELAQRVGPSGFVSGLDVVPAFLDFARCSARELCARNVSFQVADAETFIPTAPADYLFARFGTMFFERPAASFRNLRAMLKAEGQLVMTTWRGLDDNPWLGVAKSVARQHLPALGDDAVSCGPGPFSLADAELVRTLLLSVGFREVTCRPSDALTFVGRNVEEAVDFQLALGPAGELVREAGPLNERALHALRMALAGALAPFLREDGVLMPSSAWIVCAV